MKNKEEILKSGLLKYNIVPDDQILSSFLKYMELLIEKNKTINLTAINDPKEIIVEHFFDSLSVLKLNIIKPGMKMIDIGTGAGFPGLPIKIVMTDIETTLVDSSKKRVNFVRHVINTLGLKGTAVIHDRAEVLARDKEYREQYDVVVSRAVAHTRVLCEYCLPFIKKGGFFLAYKGPGINDEILFSENAIEMLGGELTGIKEVEVPFSKKTYNIVIIKKRKQIPDKYPRSSNKIKKSPL